MGAVVSRPPRPHHRRRRRRACAHRRRPRERSADAPAECCRQRGAERMHIVASDAGQRERDQLRLRIGCPLDAPLSRAERGRLRHPLSRPFGLPSQPRGQQPRVGLRLHVRLGVRIGARRLGATLRLRLVLPFFRAELRGRRLAPRIRVRRVDASATCRLREATAVVSAPAAVRPPASEPGGPARARRCLRLLSLGGGDEARRRRARSCGMRLRRAANVRAAATAGPPCTDESCDSDATRERRAPRG